ncbi:putative adenine-specific methylase [Bacteroidia bacterium]|nr:putative adenine-specific methylase [Bacteroidia bacterium]
MANENLHAAKNAKKDEFYTQMTDVNNELNHYREQFRGKVVLCNCDDPRVSNFFRYFFSQFHAMGLKGLIATCYKNLNPDLFTQNKDEYAVYCIYNGSDRNDDVIIDYEKFIKQNEWNILKGDGDFRSAECIELLKQADIVCTNPPFSLFREYVEQLAKYDKKFLIIGDQNAITYKEIFKLIKENKLWLGYENGGTKWFQVPIDYEDIPTKTRIKIENGNKYFSKGSIMWYTNLDTKKRHEELIIWKNYTPEKYPEYDNYYAINVDKTDDIPCDYAGCMGVPITFLDKYNPEQFEIIDCNDIRKPHMHIKNYGLIKDKDGAIDGKPKYVRVVIKNKKPQ